MQPLKTIIAVLVIGFAIIGVFLTMQITGCLHVMGAFN